MKTDVVLAAIRAGKAPQIGTVMHRGVGRVAVQAMGFSMPELVALLLAVHQARTGKAVPGLPPLSGREDLAGLEQRLATALRLEGAHA
jgi:hypothetical protein